MTVDGWINGWMESYLFFILHCLQYFIHQITNSQQIQTEIGGLIVQYKYNNGFHQRVQYVVPFELEEEIDTARDNLVFYQRIVQDMVIQLEQTQNQLNAFQSA